MKPFLIVGAKETLKSSLIKLIKFSRKPQINRISKREVIIMGNFETVTHTYTSEVNVVTEITQKKNGVKEIKVKTDINFRYLLPI